MEVRFVRRPDNGSIAEFTRPDGVQLRLRSYDRTGVVPHDLAHLVVEKALRLHTGLWGSLVAGAEFDSVEVVGERLRHDHRMRSAALRQTNQRDLQMAEVLVGTVLNHVNGTRRTLDQDIAGAWSIYRLGTAAPPPGVAATAAHELAGWARTWCALGVGDGVAVTWSTPRGRRHK